MFNQAVSLDDAWGTAVPPPVRDVEADLGAIVKVKADSADRPHTVAGLRSRHTRSSGGDNGKSTDTEGRASASTSTRALLHEIRGLRRDADQRYRQSTQLVLVIALILLLFIGLAWQSHLRMIQYMTRLLSELEPARLHGPYTRPPL